MAVAKSLRTAVEKLHIERVSGAEIARRVGISRSTVCSNLRELARTSEGSIRQKRSVFTKFARRSFWLNLWRRQQCWQDTKRFWNVLARHRGVLFTDKSSFTIVQFLSHQRDEVLAEDIEEANRNKRVAPTSEYPKAVVVTVDGIMLLFLRKVESKSTIRTT